MLKKFRRIIATFLSVLMVASVLIPVNAWAQVLPDEDAFSYAYADQLDLRLLEGSIFGADGEALSAAELAGVQQTWKTLADNNANLDPKTSNIDVGILEGVQIDLGGIELPLIGENGLLSFVLPDAGVGVLREHAHAPTPMEAHAAAGLISNDGGLTLTQPGDGGNLNINLLSLLNLNETSISELIIEQAGLELGALSAVAKKPNESAPAECAPDLTLVEYENLPNDKLGVEHSIIDEKLDVGGSKEGESDGTFCSAYQVADAKVAIDAPLLKTIVQGNTIAEDGSPIDPLDPTYHTGISGILDGLEETLNEILDTGGILNNLTTGLTDLLGGAVGLEATVTVPPDLINDVLDDLLLSPLQDSAVDPLVVIDLGAGTIVVDLKQLHAGSPYGLNGLAPNTPLLNDEDLGLILSTITSLLTAPPKDDPITGNQGNEDGLVARLANVLGGTTGTGSVYGIEVAIQVSLLGNVAGIALRATLGALLNPDSEGVDSIAEQQANPYATYYREDSGIFTLVNILLGLAGINLLDLVADILGGVGGILEGLLIDEGSVLSGILGDTVSLLTGILELLGPLLDNVLQPLANVIINRQRVDALENGNLFTVSAVEVNIATLLTDASLISLPLATASVLAQNGVQLDLNVSKVGNGRETFRGNYVYDLVCTVEGQEVLNTEDADSSPLTYNSGRVGYGFILTNGTLIPHNSNGDPQNGGLPEKILVPPGALCTITTTPGLNPGLNANAALRPTGSEGNQARTPYTYFLVPNSDGNEPPVQVSAGSLLDGPTQVTSDGVSIEESKVSVATSSVGNEWKNHSFSFNVPTDTALHTVNVVHAYDIDTRDIVVTKGTDGPAVAGASYNFEYSLDGGQNWVTPSGGPLTNNQSFTIEEVPLLNSELNRTDVLVREEITEPSNVGPTVSWKLNQEAPKNSTPVVENGKYYAQSMVIPALFGLTAATAETPPLVLSVTNSYPVVIDFEAMLPATGVTTLVWVLGLGLLVALAALVLFIRSRRQ